MKIKSFQLVTVLTFFLIVSFSCADHDLDPLAQSSECDASETISYSNTIKPIIISNCAGSGCHDGSLGTAKDWTNDQSFKARASEAKRRIQLPVSDSDHMPRKGELTSEEIKQISCWVDQGADISK